MKSPHSITTGWAVDAELGQNGKPIVGIPALVHPPPAHPVRLQAGSGCRQPGEAVRGFPGKRRLSAAGPSVLRSRERAESLGPRAAGVTGTT